MKAVHCLASTAFPSSLQHLLVTTAPAALFLEGELLTQLFIERFMN